MPTDVGVGDDRALPEFIAHADWGTNPRKRQVAVSERQDDGRYVIIDLAAAVTDSVERGDLRGALRVPSSGGRLLAGFDFPIGLPHAYAERIGVSSFPEFLPQIGSAPFEEFATVATTSSQISLYRPFYPYRPGGTQRAHLYNGLGLTAEQLRRRCEARDAETMFWTLGGKQVGKAAIAGWRLLAATGETIRYWPFHGTLTSLLGTGDAVVVTETYPREFYRRINGGVIASGRGAKLGRQIA